MEGQRDAYHFEPKLARDHRVTGFMVGDDRLSFALPHLACSFVGMKRPLPEGAPDTGLRFHRSGEFRTALASRLLPPRPAPPPIAPAPPPIARAPLPIARQLNRQRPSR